MKKFLSVLVVSAIALTTRATTNFFSESFTNNPAATGWQTFGDTNLFQWDSTNHDMIVTWDSSQSNSFFYHPLPTVLGLQDAFSLSFDLTLSNAVAGGDFGFELAVGLFNYSGATNSGFVRGTGFQSPNMIEFDYFPPVASFGASIDVTMADDSNDFRFLFDETDSLTNDVTYNVTINHTFGAAFVTAQVGTYDTNGQVQAFTTFPAAFGATSFTDFFVDTLSISSYNDLDADGSISATGTMANIVMQSDTRPVGNISVSSVNGSTCQIQFTSRTNWNYSLFRSLDIKTWTPISGATAAGTGTYLLLQDTNAPAGPAFYRVQASQ